MRQPTDGHLIKAIRISSSARGLMSYLSFSFLYLLIILNLVFHFVTMFWLLREGLNLPTSASKSHLLGADVLPPTKSPGLLHFMLLFITLS